jgi:hypothetical protein
MKTINEPLRAWAWHVVKAACIVVLIALAAALLLALIWTAAWALAGHGSWLPLLAVALAVVLVAGTASWLKSGRTRP